MIGNPSKPPKGSAPSPVPSSSAGGLGSQVSADGFQLLPSRCSLAESVWLPTGNLYRSISLVSVPSLGVGFGFELSHRSQDSYSGPLGHNWRHNFEMKLTIGGSQVTFVSGSGQTTHFIPDGSGGWKLDTSASLFQTFSLSNPVGTTWEITARKSGTIWRFEETPLSGFPDTAGRLLEIEDKLGNTTSLNYTSGLLASEL